jgi:type IV secretory pathway TrbD component
MYRLRAVLGLTALTWILARHGIWFWAYVSLRWCLHDAVKLIESMVGSR